MLQWRRIVLHLSVRPQSGRRTHAPSANRQQAPMWTQGIRPYPDARHAPVQTQDTRPCPDAVHQGREGGREGHLFFCTCLILRMATWQNTWPSCAKICCIFCNVLGHAWVFEGMSSMCSVTSVRAQYGTLSAPSCMGIACTLHVLSSSLKCTCMNSSLHRFGGSSLQATALRGMSGSVLPLIPPLMDPNRTDNSRLRSI